MNTGTQKKGKLYVVGTPIGNLEDVTLRALRILQESDLILCEDTRVTKKLLTHHNIDTATLSYHMHSGDAKYEKIHTLLEEGNTLALVSDAGTPTISDPGFRLVEMVRVNLPETKIEVVPGPSAVTAALSVSGVPADAFCFLGFPPHKKGRKTFFEKVSEQSLTTVFYESPHRLQKALGTLAEILPTDTKVTVVRELTKIHEQVIQGTAQEVLDHFIAHPDTVRGECVIIISYNK